MLPNGLFAKYEPPTFLRIIAPNVAAPESQLALVVTVTKTLLVLIFGVIFHFVMGFVLEIQNRKARQIKYAKSNGNANSSWMSRNMIWSGFAILAFIVLHFIDFWIPEMQYKYIDFSPENPTRYFHELVEKFHNPVKVSAYVIAFIFLILHLLHGFNSAFQSVGANNKYIKALKGFSKIYAIGIPLGFIFIALFHHFTGH